MNSFQILDKNNNPIAINELDKEACELWNKAVDTKQYAYPEVKPEKFESYKDSFNFYCGLTNWFDKIGWKIAQGRESWNTIKEEILEPFKEFSKDEIDNYLPVAGYINLINHWESKGYTPKQIIE